MEFKRLSDVEVVAEPTESANVLIEENGVIKKAPKTAVGGGGGGGAAHIVFIDGLNENRITVTDGIYEALEVFLADGINNYVDVRVMMRRDGDDRKDTMLFTVDSVYQYTGEEIINVSCNYGMSVYIHKDGNHDYYYD